MFIMVEWRQINDFIIIIIIIIIIKLLGTDIRCNNNNADSRNKYFDLYY